MQPRDVQLSVCYGLGNAVGPKNSFSPVRACAPLPPRPYIVPKRFAKEAPPGAESTKRHGRTLALPRLGADDDARAGNPRL